MFIRCAEGVRNGKRGVRWRKVVAVGGGMKPVGSSAGVKAMVAFIPNRCSRP